MRAAKFGTAIGKVSSALSFVRSELLALDEAVLQEAADIKPSLQTLSRGIIKTKTTPAPS